jgi:hypothetical protein
MIDPPVSTFARIESDMSRWPIVVHRTIGMPGDEQVDRFIDRAEAVLARGVQHVVIFDNLLADLPSPYMRKRSGDWLSANGQRMQGICLGTALMFRSPALRFVMSGVMLVASHPTPHTVCGTLDDALRWANAQLAGARAVG